MPYCLAQLLIFAAPFIQQVDQAESSKKAQLAHHRDKDVIVPEEASLRVEIPDHELLKIIGRGSYGVVWLARNSTGQHRAVKIVFRKAFSHDRPFERELSGIRKFEPISRSHEGFVDILHVGIKAGEYFYYVMELGDDCETVQKIHPDRYNPKTLGKEIQQRGKLSFDACLKLGIALSQALEELHRHNLVHRDVKPSNVVYVIGVPKLADIGLVAEVAEARSYVGTEGFIPPEGPGTPRADVYGLGKLLYESATGKDRQEFPALPADLDTFDEQVKFLEFNEVVLKACEPNPTDRYQTALEMEADLLVLLAGKSVKRLRFLESSFAAFKRLLFFGTPAVIVLGFIFYLLSREKTILTESRQRQVGIDVGSGCRVMDTGNLAESLSWFAQAIALDSDPRSQQENRIRFGCALAETPRITQMWFDKKEARMATFDPSGKRVLIIETYGIARVFDVKTAAPVSPPLKSGAGLCYGEFSPNGGMIVTADQEARAAILWDTQNWKRKLTLRHPTNVVCASFSPDGGHLMTACDDNVTRIWNTRTGHLERTLVIDGPPSSTRDLVFARYSHDGTKIVTGGRDNAVRIWNSATGLQIGPALEHPAWLTCAAFSPDDTLLATGCADGTARIYDMDSFKAIPPGMPHEDGVSSLEFSPDGQLLLIACLDHTVGLWNVAEHSPFKSCALIRTSDRADFASFSSDGHQILTTSIDGVITIWDLAKSTMTPRRLPYIFSENGERYASWDSNKVEIRDTASMQLVSQAFHPSSPIREAKLDPAGKLLVLMSDSDNTSPENQAVQIFNVADGHEVAPELIIPVIFTNLTLSEDGHELLGFGEKKCRVWSTTTGKPISPIISTARSIQAVSVSRDGDEMLVCQTDRASLFKISTGEPVFSSLVNSNLGVLLGAACFSPDNSTIAACWWDTGFAKYAAEFYNAKTGSLISSAFQHDDGVLSEAFSRDGRLFVTGGEDRVAIVWNAATGEQIAPPLRNPGRVKKVMFGENGKVVASISQEGTSRLWSAETGVPLSPPLKYFDMLADGALLPDGKHLLAIDTNHRGWLWETPTETRPLDDLRMLAYLISNDKSLGNPKTHTSGQSTLESAWTSLRTKYPEEFLTTADEVARYHEYAADKAEALGRWQAAEFHLAYLHSIMGNDKAITERLDFARQKQRITAAKPQ